jgi:MalT-like TPR region
LQAASGEYSGHCLALTLLGSYLSDAYNGDIRSRKEVSTRLAQDVRQGAHARKVLASYQNWFGEGPELSLLRILGLFDRPTDERAIGALLKAPAIPGLTESLTNLSPTDWRTILAKLRRARLLACEDPHNSAQLDAHPLVREYFGEQLRMQRAEAWEESNKRLYHYYEALAPHQTDSFREMEPLFLAAICGCKARLFRKVLQEIYIPRIQRGDVSFAANVLGLRGALLSMLIHFFANLRWDSPLAMGLAEQRLTAEDELYILSQTALYLTTTRGMGAPDARVCYERIESLCQTVHRPPLLYSSLIGQWRYALTADKLNVAMKIARRIYAMAQEQNDRALLTGAYNALACTVFSMGDFENAREYANRGAQIWRTGGAMTVVEEVDAPAVSCLVHKALSEWHLAETISCHKAIADAILLAKELKDMPALTNAVFNAGILNHYERNVSEVERLSSEVIALSTRHNFAFWLAIGSILRGWARSASAATAEGIPCIEDGIQDYQATGPTLGMPYFLALKAEALYLADRTSEALDAIGEAEVLAQRSGSRSWYAELHRLRGVFLAATGGDEFQMRARSDRLSESQRNRNRLRWKSERKHPMQDTAAKRRGL